VFVLRAGDDDRDVAVEDDGTFMAPLVPEGTWSVQAWSGERRTPIVAVVVHAGQESHVPDLALENCARLRVIAGSIGPDASIEVRHGSDLFVSQRLRSNDTDPILVPPGDLQVLVRDPRRGEERHEVLVVAGVESMLSVLRDP
jgi:hypothetical protein